MDYEEKYNALIQIIVNNEGQGIYPCGHLTKEQRESFTGSDPYKCGWNAAIIDGETKVKKLLSVADDLDEDKTMLLASGQCFIDEDGNLSINMNDTWGWALSWLPTIPADQVSEVARLFRNYGHAGLMYWHSTQENNMRSEFADNNRALDFVQNEERIRKEIRDSTKLAYHKESYTIGK